MERFIDLVIDPDGTIHVDMECYKGVGCDVDFKKLVKALGVTVVSKKKNQEYYDEGKAKVQGKQ